MEPQAQEWPELPYESWKDTLETVHRWTQVVGKIRLRTTPLVNHWWNVTFYVTPRGLTTSPMPFGKRSFSIEFDFRDHHLRIDDSNTGMRQFALEPMSVAEFYRRTMEALAQIGITVRIVTTPNEVTDAVPLDKDEVHRSYDRSAVERFFTILRNTDRVFNAFRSDFVGKCSPVHFFWGSFDLAYTRFSGRPAPPHPGGFPNMPDAATREAYSHEEFSVGLWPGGFGLDPLFYAYGYPEPPGFVKAAVKPVAAFYQENLKEFVLPYDAVRTSAQPEQTLLEFCRSTYEAVATLGAWDRGTLERPVSEVNAR